MDRRRDLPAVDFEVVEGALFFLLLLLNDSFTQSLLASEMISLVLFAACLGCLFSLLAPRRIGCTHLKIRVGLTCNEWLLVRNTEYLFDLIQSLLGRGIRDALLLKDVESEYPAPLPELIPPELLDI